MKLIVNDLICFSASDIRAHACREGVGWQTLARVIFKRDLKVTENESDHNY